MAIKPKQPAPDDDEMIVIDFDGNESGHLWNNRSNIFIATPMYGGMCSGYYTQGVLGLIGVLSGMGHSSATSFIFNESLITRARNMLTHKFLESDCTHMLFIDADISFEPAQVPLMIQKNVPVICGIYPKKEINWPAVHEAAMNGVAATDLHKHSGSLVVNLVGYSGEAVVRADQPAEIWNGGTGFMLIKREVFEKLADKVPAYNNDVVDSLGSFKHGFSIKEYFTTSIEPGTNRLLSEDYHFCRLCRENDIKIYAAPWVQLGHMGSYLFSGGLVQTDAPCTQS
jgi:hypothetical protein